MGEWVDTPYGKRFEEDYGNITAFFMTKPNKDRKRYLLSDVVKIILEDKIIQENEMGIQKSK